MTLTTFYTSTSLDGFLADEHDSLDWLLEQPDDDGPMVGGPMGYADFVAGIGAMCMGSTTYRWIVEHQAALGEPWPYTTPAFVFTHGEPEVMRGADVRLVRGDVRPVHDAMVEAADGQGVWIVGGGDLAAQFADAGLLDEIVVAIAPVTLGAGRPLFPRRHDLTLTELAHNGVFGCARYRVSSGR
jgi:dihydrofolate reductase